MRNRVTMLELMRLARPVVLSVAVALSGCASSTSGFEDESNGEPQDTNLVKGMMTSLGAIDPKERPIEYKPRSPLVVPPKRELPAPQDADAALAQRNFPRNQEDIDREMTKRGGNDPDPSRPWTPDQLARYRMSGQPTRTGSDDNPGRRLTPEEMAGQFKRNQEAIAIASNNGKKTLTEPPKDYRTPSPKAPVDPEGEKKESSWKPSWWPL